MGTPVVRTKLQVDTAEATEGLKRVKGGFKEVSGEAKNAGDAAHTFATQAAAQFVAMNLGPAAHEVYEFGKSFFDAAAGGDAADTAVASLITTVQGIPWRQSKAQAQGFGDDLDAISIKAGVAGNDVGNAFQAMLELRGASAEGTSQAVKDVESISMIAGQLGKSSEGLAREYAMATEGVIKTKGQLFQLLQTTGIFGKETKKASAYWATLTDESRIKALDYGLARVADSMDRTEPSAKQLMTSMENLYDMTKEKLGEPLMNELIPVLKDVQKEWSDAIPDIEKFAHLMSKDLAAAVKTTVADAKIAFQYLVDHHEEIRAAISDGVDKAKAVVEFIIARKEAIALAFGAKMAAPALGAGAKVLGGVVEASASGIGGLAGTGGGVLAGGAAVVAFGAAVGAWALAIDQWKKLMDETGGGKSEAEQDQAARKTSLEGMIAKPDAGQWNAKSLKGFEDLRKAYVDGATALGEDSRVAGEFADKAYRAHLAFRQTVQPVEEAGAAIDKLAIAAQFFPEEAGQMSEQTDTAVAAIAGAFTKASAAHNDAATAYIANMLTKSTEVQKAFLMSADLTAEGFDALAKLVEGSSMGFADKLREIGGEKARGGAGTPAAPTIQMTGGQTFNIKQDFRDQDPDRVFVTFETDVMKAATRRLQSGMALPFGG